MRGCSQVWGIRTRKDASMRWEEGKRTRPQAVALIGVILFLATFLPVVALAGTWQIHTVDSAAGYNAHAAERTSIALDSSGRPHISYYDRSFNDLGYARFDGSSWTVQVVDSTDNVGGYSSIALDSLGRPHISYHYWSANPFVYKLKYAHFNGTSWSLTVVDDSLLVGEYTSLDLDSFGYPHISYSDGQNFALKYASFNGSSWAKNTIKEKWGVGIYISMVLDAYNRPHIAYTDYSYTATDGYDLRYYNGSTGTIVTVDPPEAQYDISLALDANNHPHISYTSCVWGAAPCDLKYAYFDGSSWSITTVEPDVGRDTSIAVDSSGRPHIVYKTFSGLKYVRFSGTTWVKEQIETNAGYGSSLALDSRGNGHVSFYSFDSTCYPYICLQYATNALGPFSDVPSDYWAYYYIMAIYNAHITIGCSQNPLKYCPEDYVTREQMAAFIVRAKEGEPLANYCELGTPFPDVSSGMWSCKYIKRLKELGITTGYQDGTYGPFDFVPREQMAAFIVRAVEGEPPANYCDSGTPFPDVTSDMWSCRYIKRLKELGITTGYQDGTYGPYDIVTRAQMAAFLARAFLGME